MIVPRCSLHITNGTDTDMKARGLLTCILVTAIFIIPALPPVASVITLPTTPQVQTAVMDFYHAARTILYASLAISVANVALTYHVWKKQE